MFELLLNFQGLLILLGYLISRWFQHAGEFALEKGGPSVLVVFSKCIETLRCCWSISVVRLSWQGCCVVEDPLNGPQRVTLLFLSPCSRSTQRLCGACASHWPSFTAWWRSLPPRAWSRKGAARWHHPSSFRRAWWPTRSAFWAGSGGEEHTILASCSPGKLGHF